MNAVKLFIDVDSEDIHIPELKKFIGKKVEMIILEVPNIQPDEEKQNVADSASNDPDFSTAKSLLKYSGSWVGPKEEIKEIIKYIEDSESDAEF